MDTLYSLLTRHIRILGAVALAVCIVTWWMDLTGLVFECVYCRTQRTAIGIAGILLMFPNPRAWWVRYPASAVCFLGASVAAAQLFLVIRNVSSGKPLNVEVVILATGALFALVGMAMILFTPKPPDA
jgi:hypothetical protein